LFQFTALLNSFFWGKHPQSWQEEEEGGGGGGCSSRSSTSSPVSTNENTTTQHSKAFACFFYYSLVSQNLKNPQNLESNVLQQQESVDAGRDPSSSLYDWAT
jgi:hypothetical protein